MDRVRCLKALVVIGVLTGISLWAIDSFAAQTDWSDGDSNLTVRTAIQANDTELYAQDAAQDSLISANTSKTTNATHTGDVTGATALTIAADKVLESHLKAVDSPADEECLTYESTTGDFEWQACGSGAVATDTIWDAAGDLVYGTGSNTASRLAAGATTEIFVGGGAAAPVWTTATGTGAPARAGSPIFTGTVGAAAITATGLITADSLDTDEFTVSTAGAVVAVTLSSGTATFTGTTTVANLVVTTSADLPSTVAVPSLTPVTGSTTGFAAAFTGNNLKGGTYVVDNDNGDLQLPLMATGYNFSIITLGAIEVVADTNVADGYLLDGVTGTEGKNITNLSGAGDMAVFQYYTADDWLITTNGWTAE